MISSNIVILYDILMIILKFIPYEYCHILPFLPKTRN